MRYSFALELVKERKFSEGNYNWLDSEFALACVASDVVCSIVLHQKATQVDKNSRIKHVLSVLLAILKMCVIKFWHPLVFRIIQTLLL